MIDDAVKQSDSAKWQKAWKPNDEAIVENGDGTELATNKGRPIHIQLQLDASRM